MKTTYYIVAQNKPLTDWMQKADVFESFKVIADIISMETEKIFNQSYLDEMRRQMDAHEECKVIAMFAPNIPDVAYRDPSVKVVSDGKKWGLLDDFIRHYHGPESILEANLQPTQTV